VHGRHGETSGGAQDGDVLALCLGIQPLERLFLARPELLVDGAAPHLVVFALEQRRQDASELIERGHHALGQHPCPAMRELQRARPIGIIEVVDIGPVGRRGGLGSLRPEVGLHRRGLAGGRWAQHEDVEVVALDVGAELDGFQRAILTDQLSDRVQLVGGLEAERPRVDDPAQLGRFERLRARRDRRYLPTGDHWRAVMLRPLEKHAISHPFADTARDNMRPSRPRKDHGRWVFKSAPFGIC
jgi:hypothetical protein